MAAYEYLPGGIGGGGMSCLSLSVGGGPIGAPGRGGGGINL